MRISSAKHDQKGYEGEFEIMIIMKDVHKTYSNGVTAVNGFDVNIEHGEFVYIVGPSGAGKSTFIRLIYREEAPTKGEITIKGIKINEMKRKEVPFLRRDIGVVFQDFKLLPTLTVYENVGIQIGRAHV